MEPYVYLTGVTILKSVRATPASSSFLPNRWNTRSFSRVNFWNFRNQKNRARGHRTTDFIDKQCGSVRFYIIIRGRRSTQDNVGYFSLLSLSYFGRPGNVVGLLPEYKRILRLRIFIVTTLPVLSPNGLRFLFLKRRVCGKSIVVSVSSSGTRPRSCGPRWNRDRDGETIRDDVRERSAPARRRLRRSARVQLAFVERRATTFRDDAVKISSSDLVANGARHSSRRSRAPRTETTKVQTESTAFGFRARPWTPRKRTGSGWSSTTKGSTSNFRTCPTRSACGPRTDRCVRVRVRNDFARRPRSAWKVFCSNETLWSGLVACAQSWKIRFRIQNPKSAKSLFFKRLKIV